MAEDKKTTRHNAAMQKQKANVDAQIEAADTERGVAVLITGNGKGKTSSAFGMVMRALGYGMKVGVVQFVKGKWGTGERQVLDAFPDQVTLATMGEGFTWETQDRQRDITAARQAWEKAKEMILDDTHDMVLCDELNIVLRYDYLPVDEIIETLKRKPEMKHVIITGRNAKDDLVEFADLVTEMEMVKHPFRSGVKAQVGIEF